MLSTVLTFAAGHLLVHLGFQLHEGDVGGLFHVLLLAVRAIDGVAGLFFLGFGLFHSNGLLGVLIQVFVVRVRFFGVLAGKFDLAELAPWVVLVANGEAKGSLGIPKGAQIDVKGESREGKAVRDCSFMQCLADYGKRTRR